MSEHLELVEALERAVAQRSGGVGQAGAAAVRVVEADLPPIRRRAPQPATIGEALAETLPNGELWLGLWIAVRESAIVLVVTWGVVIALSLAGAPERPVVAGADVPLTGLSLGIALLLRAVGAVLSHATRPPTTG